MFKKFKKAIHYEEGQLNKWLHKIAAINVSLQGFVYCTTFRKIVRKIQSFVNLEQQSIVNYVYYVKI